MSLISERNHESKLKEKKINIKTIYSDGTNKYEKNTDESKNDNLSRGVIVEKDYFVNNKIIKKLYGFDPRIEYTFINSQAIGTEYDCPNCRMITKITEGTERCPCCGSFFNLDYKNKDQGSKGTYDLVVHDKKYIIITLLIDLTVSFLLSYLYFSHGRTYNVYDLGKTFVVGLGLALVLFFFFYIIDGLIVLLPIRLKKEKINQNDIKLWKDLDDRKILYNTFYNNLHYELDKHYYVDSNNSIIDYDVIDYYNFKLVEDASNLYLKLDCLIREVKYENKRVETKTIVRKLVFKRNNKPSIHTDDGDIHTINCHNCGASIDVTSEKCVYCDTPNNYNQEWYLTKIS